MNERQTDKSNRNPLRILWLIAGFAAMGLGAVGVVLPVLPTMPFLLLASFCLAKGSKRFHRWFTGTGLYRRHLESFVRDRAMTLKTKFSLLIPASCMLLLAFWAMPNLYGRCFILFLIAFKYVYFFTKIRTIPAGAAGQSGKETFLDES
ncbi:MAG: YbaN family protein [Eubacteriales bacterium]|nr:YbaN family protein [Eubacteriales bacterium]